MGKREKKSDFKSIMNARLAGRVDKSSNQSLGKTLEFS